jgi:O-antigen/teichoic acid export membrane protein
VVLVVSIARNTLITIGGTAASIAVTLVTVPLYIKAIGLERYGVLAVVWTILAYFGLVELGVSGAMVQRLARGMLSPRQRITLYWTGFTMNALMGLIGGALLWLSFNALMTMMSFSTVEVEIEIRSAGVLVAALIVVMTLRSVNNSVLYGAERFVTATVLSTLETVASAIAPLAVAIFASANIYCLIAAILAVRTLFLVASFVVMIPSLPGFRLARGHMSQARDLLSIGFWFWLAGLIAPLMTYFDRFLIGSVVGVAQLPYYSVPQTILQQSSHIPRALGSVLFPRFSAMKDDATAAKLAIKAMEAMSFAVTPISVILILTVQPMLATWLSEDFAEKSYVVAVVLMFSLLPSAISRVIASQLNGRNRPDLVVKVLLVEIVPYGIGLYVLSRSFGLLGVAIMWTLRVTVDTLLLAWMSKVLVPMLKELLFPIVLAVSALTVSLQWSPHDPRGWASSVGILVIVAAWAVCFMPPSLSQAIGRVRFIRHLPIGRFYRSKVS